MNIKKLFIRIVSLVLISSLLIAFIIPIVVKADDSNKKITLNTIEDIEKYVDNNKYPGYKEKLIALKKENPNWKFTLYFTGIKWETAIYNETKGLHSRSLVQNKSG